MNGGSVKLAPEVFVVGASTAGLFAAYLLAREGVRVRVFEQAERLDPPARTLIITSRIADVLGYYPAEAVVNATRYLQIFSPHRTTTIELREPDLIVERQKLVQLLASRALDAGVQIDLGCRFLGFEPDGDGLVCDIEDQSSGQVRRMRTRFLVGADGVSSEVAQALGCPGRDKVALLQARVALPSTCGLDTTQVWFDPSSTRFFYWLEPEPPDRATVGLIADDQCQAKASLDRFLSALALTPLAYQSALVPFYSSARPPERRISGARILLIGDAAAQVKMTTVGGVVTGLRGAEAAVRAILRGTSYAWEARSLRWELDLHLLVHRVVSHLSSADYDALLGLLGQRERGILGAYTRDEISRILFPSLLVQPGFLAVAAKGFLRWWGLAGRAERQSAAVDTGRPDDTAMQNAVGDRQQRLASLSDRSA